MTNKNNLQRVATRAKARMAKPDKACRECKNRHCTCNEYQYVEPAEHGGLEACDIMNIVLDLAESHGWVDGDASKLIAENCIKLNETTPLTEADVAQIVTNLGISDDQIKQIIADYIANNPNDDYIKNVFVKCLSDWGIEPDCMKDFIKDHVYQAIIKYLPDPITKNELKCYIEECYGSRLHNKSEIVEWIYQELVKAPKPRTDEDIKCVVERVCNDDKIRAVLFKCLGELPGRMWSEGEIIALANSLQRSDAELKLFVQGCVDIPSQSELEQIANTQALLLINNLPAGLDKNEVKSIFLECYNSIANDVINSVNVDATCTDGILEIDVLVNGVAGSTLVNLNKLKGGGEVTTECCNTSLTHSLSGSILTTQVTQSDGAPVVGSIDLAALSGSDPSVECCNTGITQTLNGTVLTTQVTQTNGAVVSESIDLAALAGTTSTECCNSNLDVSLNGSSLIVTVEQTNGSTLTDIVDLSSLSGSEPSVECCNTGLQASLSGSQLTLSVTQTNGAVVSDTIDLSSLGGTASTECCNTGINFSLSGTTLTGEVTQTNGATVVDTIDLSSLAGQDGADGTQVSCQTVNGVTTIFGNGVALCSITGGTSSVEVGGGTVVTNADGSTTFILTDTAGNQTSVTIPAECCNTNLTADLVGNILTINVDQTNGQTVSDIVDLSSLGGSGSVECCNTGLTASLNGNLLTLSVTQTNGATVSDVIDLSSLAASIECCNTGINFSLSGNTLTGSVTQTNGVTVTDTIDLSSLAGQDGAAGTQVSCQTVNGVTTIFGDGVALCSITGGDSSVEVGGGTAVTNADGSISIVLTDTSGTQTSVIIPAPPTLTCVLTADTDGCSEYQSLRFNGAEICKLPVYEPTECCLKYCVTYTQSTEEVVTFLTASGFDWTWDGQTTAGATVTGSKNSTVAGGLAQTFEPGTYEFTICQNNACEKGEPPTFSTGLPTSKHDCGC